MNKKRGRAPPSSKRRPGGLSLLCHLLLRAALGCLLRHVNPPFQVWITRGSVPRHRDALCRLARRVAMSATSLRRLAPGKGPNASRPSQESSIRAKKIGVLHLSTPKVTSKNYRFFAAFFFAPLAAFFAIFFSSGCCDSASDAHAGRHNGWAEPSTLIPDVDYG